MMKSSLSPTFSANVLVCTADSPEGFNLDKPFKLPYQIQRVELQRGLAVIVQ